MTTWLTSNGVRVQHFLHTAAADKGHDEVERVALAEVVQRDDMGVIQRGGQAGLAQEPLTKARTLRQAAIQHLHGNFTAQANVARKIDLRHAALANFSDELIGTQLPLVHAAAPPVPRVNHSWDRLLPA